MLHAETVCKSTLDLLKDILQVPDMSAMRLVGGTALSLQLGHRTSVDLDLFGNFDSTRSFRKLLINRGHVVEGAESGDVQSLVVDGVKSEIAFALRGLTYFDDAEDDPMPKMFVPLTWDAVKTRLLSAVQNFIRLA